MTPYGYSNYVKLPGERRGTLTDEYKDKQLPAGSTKVTSTIDPENPGAVAPYKRIITYGETPLQNDTTYMYQNKINPFALLYFAPIEKYKILKAQTHPSAPQTNSDPVYYTAAELQGGQINYLHLFK